MILEVFTRGCGPGLPSRMVYRNMNYSGAIPRVGEFVQVGKGLISVPVREVCYILDSPAGRADVILVLDTSDPNRDYPEVKS